MRAILITILIILLPSNLYHRTPTIPCTMGEMVGQPLYTQYWEARMYHGNYIVWDDKGTLWFERNGQIIEFKKR